MDFVRTIAWVPRGKSKEIPNQVLLKPDEPKHSFERIRSADSDQSKNLFELELESYNETDTERVGDSTDDEDPESKANPDDATDDVEKPAFGGGTSGFKSLADLSINGSGLYARVNEVDDVDSDDIDSDDEDFKILPRDNLLAVAHVDEDAYTLEIYVYNEDNDDLYVHHEISLPSCPLVLEWMSHLPGNNTVGNLVAVGTTKPTIQMWDLNVVGATEPLFELKGINNKRERHQDTTTASGHSNAVLALAWNPLVKNVCASGSADQTVILWNLDQCKPSTILKGFLDRVQVVRWRPSFVDQLLCGSYDKSVRLFDCRCKKTKETIWSLESEIEHIVWSTTDNNYFYVATKGGELSALDVRKTSATLTTVQAHGKDITGLVTSAHIPGLLVTTSKDEMVKIWDVQRNNLPEFVFEKKLGMGEIQSAAMSPDSPFVVALCGSNMIENFGRLALNEFSEVMTHFESRIPNEHIRMKEVSTFASKSEGELRPLAREAASRLVAGSQLNGPLDLQAMLNRARQAAMKDPRCGFDSRLRATGNSREAFVALAHHIPYIDLEAADVDFIDARVQEVSPEKSKELTVPDFVTDGLLKAVQAVIDSTVAIQRTYTTETSGKTYIFREDKNEGIGNTLRWLSSELDIAGHKPRSHARGEVLKYLAKVIGTTVETLRMYLNDPSLTAKKPRKH